MEKLPPYDLPGNELAYISDYLNGALDASAQRAFEERLHRDPLFKQKVDEVRWLLVGVREANLAEQLDSFHAVLPGNKEEVTHTKAFRRQMTWLAAAILVFGIVGAWLFWSRQTPEQRLFSQYYRADPGLPTLMGPSDDYAFEEAMVDYKTGNFRKAIDKWRPLLADGRENDTLNYFIGVAYLAANEPDSATMFLDHVVGISASAFRSDAHWYKALALLKQGQSEAALKALRHTEHPAKDALLHAIKILP
ncbi:hypothetical protein [Parapedobacter indicus]|uniref:Tetratricopeptide repeat-containing protein n=1 Tax=Parapedobacter indicus TaxID=1477437 RepID=A0A1I3U5W3_9SPHI|nr:hypothetical protein [Parapedobacter indicus]PPK99165.1 hypothetical protein CLV26_11415 [Parapedobacter indicus]SFJ78302.1 hypothetical protein SAMN05444682_11415 [Parapedobacter indicus]